MIPLLQQTAAPLRNSRLWALHIPCNALLLTAALFWMRIPDEHWWQLALTVLSALAIAFLFLWLHASTLRSAAGYPLKLTLRESFSLRWLGMLWLLFGLTLLIVLMSKFDDYSDTYLYQVSGYLYSKLPQWLRPVSGEFTLAGWLAHLSTFVRIFLLPALLLPSIAAGVIGGKTKAALRTLIRWRYWLIICVSGAVGIWLPRIILDWTPGTHLRAMTVSLALRLGVAYLLAIAAWLAATGLLSYFVSGRDAPVAKP